MCAHVYVYIYMCVCTCTYIYISVHACMHTQTPRYVYVHITHTYTWTPHFNHRPIQPQFNADSYENNSDSHETLHTYKINFNQKLSLYWMLRDFMMVLGKYQNYVLVCFRIFDAWYEFVGWLLVGGWLLACLVGGLVLWSELSWWVLTHALLPHLQRCSWTVGQDSILERSEGDPVASSCLHRLMPQLSSDFTARSDLNTFRRLATDVKHRVSWEPVYGGFGARGYP